MIGDRELGKGDAAYDYISRKWGGIQTRPFFTPGAAVTATAARFLKSNPRRMEWTIFNLGLQSMWLWFDGTVTSSNGILIPAQGGSVTSAIDEDGELVTYDVWLISPNATTAAAIEVQQV